MTTPTRRWKPAAEIRIHTNEADGDTLIEVVPMTFTDVFDSDGAALDAAVLRARSAAQAVVDAVDTCRMVTLNYAPHHIGGQFQGWHGEHPEVLLGRAPRRRSRLSAAERHRAERAEVGRMAARGGEEPDPR